MKNGIKSEENMKNNKVVNIENSHTELVLGFKNLKIGFTLAEVLITLGIIGIVAAMTIPTVIAKHKEKQNVSKLKKVYSTLSQAMTSIIHEYGTIDTWNLSKSYESSDDGQVIVDDTSMVILVNRLAEYVKHKRLEKNWGDNIVTTNMQNVPISNQIWPNAMILHDGTVLMIGQVNSNGSCARSDMSKGDYCSTIVVWFPDRTKKRIEGINQFNFSIMKDRIIPWGAPNDVSHLFNTRCNIKNNVRESGRGCTAWVIFNENMDYLHCDDLSWDGKKKCK